MKKYLFLLIVFICLLQSCEYFELIPYKKWRKMVEMDEVDVYCAGYYTDAAANYYICYWKNGELHDLENNLIHNSAVNITIEILIHNDDIYVTGYYWNGINEKACYWKNGRRHELSNFGTGNSVATGISINSGVVGISGIDNLNACYWINGDKYNLMSGQVMSIFIDDYANIYLAGIDMTGTNTGFYFKNGKITYLNLGDVPYSLTVNNGIVYMCGTKSPNYGTFWKNDEYIFSESAISYFRSIFIYKGDLYTAGNDPGNSTYWKNDKKNVLETGIGHCIKVFDDDTYVSGRVSSGGGDACYWKNNDLNILKDIDGYDSIAYSIFVKWKD